ncbi:MAG: 50S ribosomal protein L30 [Bacteroidia bacterium]|nr:50S ribosomal protein L30 [Bacteroidia bacterium]
MAKIKITQVRSKIGATKKQKATLEALGLRRINATVEKETSPQVLGMIAKVNHLINVEQ